MDDTTIEVHGQRMRALQAGSGPRLLYLHGFTGLSWSPLLQQLSSRYSVLAPEHPGFGRSKVPDWMMGIGDLAYFYLDLLKALDLRRVHLVGHAVGGWIASELAIRNTSRLQNLTLLAPAGVVVPGASIADVFLMPTDEFMRRQLHDPGAPASGAWLKEQVATEIDIVLENREALARIGWSPRLHNPQLALWLHRIDVPTLLIWGEDDRIVPFACHKPYMQEIAGIELMSLPAAGHALQAERAEAIAGRMQTFLAGASR